MPPVFTLNASAVPQVQARATLFKVSDLTPVVAPAFVAGLSAASQLPAYLKELASREDGLGLYGTGGPGVQFGLDLTAGSGLTLNISAGRAGIFSGVEKTAAATLALTDAVRNYIWISQAGTLSKKTSADASPLLPPDLTALWCFLGSVPCAAGAITAVDYSGRVSLDQLSGLAYRQTADAGAPTDTPPASVRFLNRTAGGLYLWDGSAYVLIDQAAGLAGAVALPGDLTPAQITSDQNNYAPTGHGAASTLRLSSDAARNLTGLAGGTDGRLLLVHNVGSFALTLKDESASSTAGNRFALPADLLLPPDTVALLQYDSTAARWRALSAVGALVPGNNLSDLASASTARTNLGLGSIATQDASAVAVTGGTVTGITDLAVADGGTGASTAAAALGNLGGLSKAADDTIADGVDYAVGSSSGTKIGTATSQKLGFWNATPIVQPAALADTSGATLAQLEAEVNSLKAKLRALGLMAP